MKDFKKKIEEKIIEKEDKNSDWINKYLPYPNKFSSSGKKYLTQYYLSNHLGKGYKNLKDIFSTRAVNTLFNRLSRHFRSNSIFEDDFKCIFGVFFPYPDKDLIEKKQKIIKQIINSDVVDIDPLFKKSENKIIGLDYQVYYLEEESEIKSDIEKLESEYELNISALPISREELREIKSVKNIIIISEEVYSEIAISINELELLIKGFLFEQNKKELITFIQNLNDFNLDLINEITNFLTDNNNEIKKTDYDLKEEINAVEEINKEIEDKNKAIKDLENEIISIEEIKYDLNNKVEEILNKKDITIDAKSMIDALKNEDYSEITKDFKEDIDKKIQEYEDKFIEKADILDIRHYDIFEKEFPIEVDKENLNLLEKELDNKKSLIQIENQIDIGKEIEKIEKGLPNILSKITLGNVLKIVVFQDFINTIKKTLVSKSKNESGDDLNFPKINEELVFYLDQSYNFFFDANPINYGLNTEKIGEKNQKISILTGANSGGKTTLLELVLQSILLSYMGMPLCSKSSNIPLIDNIYYFKKFSGRQNAGAFEQTIKKFIKASTENKNKRKLILIDEFESITEPDAAAKILVSFLKVLEKTNTLSVVVSHLGKELKDEIDDSIRLDGIFAKGLDENNNLLTDHQPLFNKRGRSTPELILQKIVLNEKQWNESNIEMKNYLKGLIKELR
ncbi:MAG: AAA family ATPase [Candidatus Woesearchaeota archaeon]